MKRCQTNLGKVHKLLATLMKQTLQIFSQQIEKLRFCAVAVNRLQLLNQQLNSTSQKIESYCKHVQKKLSSGNKLP